MLFQSGDFDTHVSHCKYLHDAVKIYGYLFKNMNLEHDFVENPLQEIYNVKEIISSLTFFKVFNTFIQQRCSGKIYWF